MNDTQKRREEILALVGEREIHTQDELVAALAERGFVASQASVSRDVAALGLAKFHGRYARPERPPGDDDPRLARIREGLLGVGRAGDHMLVLRTPPGEASAVGVAFDQMRYPGVVGSVAGDDTILVAVESAARLRELMHRLENLVSVES